MMTKESGMNDGRKRVCVENLQPVIENGRYPIKRVVGEEVRVTADIVADGHEVLSARVLYRVATDKKWHEASMVPIGNDSWKGRFEVAKIGTYAYTVLAWVDRFLTWQSEFKKRLEAGQDLNVQLQVGAQLVTEAAGRAKGSDRTYLQEAGGSLNDEAAEERADVALSSALSDVMRRHADRSLASQYPSERLVTVERAKALFSTWYECFPRSCSSAAEGHGTFGDVAALLPEIARMGFDVLYLPPIHPIGKLNRKGKNNSPKAEPGDEGSPWAIGSDEGGHKAVHASLGTEADYVELLKRAKELGIELAMDLAFQCAPDHPYVKEHPEWFRWLPDGSVQYAENPPKKYEDILPLHFETEDWQSLWDELLSVALYWAERGVRLFRVDNPHTKPFRFWEWFVAEAKKQYPDVIFLSEAFARPKVMYQLAKVGFSQSYTYFTWRNTKPEFTEYITHLLNTDVREFFRANFWPNTPDILPEHLQYGGRPAFAMRLVLAATLSSSYGIYGPPFELCVSDAASGKEEYLNSEKYEVRHWDRNAQGNLKDLIARVNAIRRENPALQTTWNLRFFEVDNEYILCYGKADEERSNIILVVVNLDPAHTQSGWVTIPLKDLDIHPQQPYLVHDLLSDEKYIWHGERNFVQIDPHAVPAQIFRIHRRMKRETDFDYYF